MSNPQATRDRARAHSAIASKLPPGSPQARAQGCLCPVLDNSHGRGYMGQPGVFMLRGDCRVHGPGTTPIETEGETYEQNH